MKKKLNYFLVFLWLGIVTSTACDVCNIYDYTGRQNKTFVGIFYRYRVMNGYSHIHPEVHKFVINDPNARTAHDIEGTGFYHHKTNKDFQTYHVVDLRFNYALKDKINIGCIVPMLFNKAHYAEIYYDTKPVSDSTVHTMGLGDVLIFSDYVFSWERDDKKAFVKPGFALKVPTGNDNLGANGMRYPHEIQTGTGSIDFLLRLNANVRRHNLGAEWLSSYRINTVHDNYKFGNSFNATLNPYYVVDLNDNLSIVPKIGTYAEIFTADRQGPTKRTDTGGNTWYGNVGLDVLYGNFIVQTLFQKPLIDKLQGQQLGNAGRVVVGLVYNIY
ncbi:MAG TPA: hypothetical protein VL947_01010 [Cytophagales bacterium]|nr:hypothetical protein [Cytophagales bacterium]